MLPAPVWAYIRVSGEEQADRGLRNGGQHRAIGGLLGHEKFNMPRTDITLAQAERVKEQGDQGKLL